MSSTLLHSLTNEAAAAKRKRRPAGTPDPDAEVVSLSPRTLLESDRYVCEICNQGFQRDQNLQMHRRRHKVPWKLLKRDPATAAGGAAQIRKRVFVCPEPSCLHHDPGHALGDLVGIKKHYRRKHSDRRQWVCAKCSKGYAVQSDYKAHLKTCGTRGHTCDCGKVFSRVESFIEHQDSCIANRSSTSTPSTDTDFVRPSIELQLLPSSASRPPPPPPPPPPAPCISRLNLSLSLSSEDDQMERPGKRQVEIAEQEYAKAKRIRQQAQAELDKAFVLREHAARSINSVLLHITCQSCKLSMWPESGSLLAVDENSVAPTSAVTDGGNKVD